MNEITAVFEKIRMVLLIRSAKRMLKKKYFKIKENIVSQRRSVDSFKRKRQAEKYSVLSNEDEYDEDEEVTKSVQWDFSALPAGIPKMKLLEKFFHEKYESSCFADALNQYMHEKNLSTAVLYNRCLIDRKLISKIVSNQKYHPSKVTVFALCIGLRLNHQESEHFLGLAGYAFNPNSKYDLLIEFSINNRVYDIDQVNEILYAFHEPCFGE